MKATITDLQRRSARLMQRVDAGETVELTRHGATVARMIPLPKTLTGREIAARLKGTPRLGADIANEMVKTLKDLDDAT
jgi:prevent-host-death family protein